MYNGFSIEKFLGCIRPAYMSLSSLPPDLHKFGEQYLDLSAASMLMDAFVDSKYRPPICTARGDELREVLEVIGGENGLNEYLGAWKEAANAISANPAPYKFLKSLLWSVEEMKGINDPDECIRWMDSDKRGKILAQRDKVKLN